jgi:hypothetical protein
VSLKSKGFLTRKNLDENFGFGFGDRFSGPRCDELKSSSGVSSISISPVPTSDLDHNESFFNIDDSDDFGVNELTSAW